jgi:ribosomal protein S18 acetylase RimI-like enzyme
MGDRMSRRSLRRLLSRPSAITLAAVADGEIVGYAMLLLRRNSGVARVYSLVRAATASGRGVGEALLTAAERAAAERGAVEMRLEVRPDNPRARSLYGRHNYAVFARIADYYEDHADALRMRKSLIGTRPE